MKTFTPSLTTLPTERPEHTSDVLAEADSFLASLDSLPLTRPERTAIDDFWAGITDWQWNDDIISVRQGPRGSAAWMR